MAYIFGMCITEAAINHISRKDEHAVFRYRIRNIKVEFILLCACIYQVAVIIQFNIACTRINPRKILIEYAAVEFLEFRLGNRYYPLFLHIIAIYIIRAHESSSCVFGHYAVGHIAFTHHICGNEQRDVCFRPQILIKSKASP